MVWFWQLYAISYRTCCEICSYYRPSDSVLTLCNSGVEKTCDVTTSDEKLELQRLSREIQINSFLQPHLTNLDRKIVL